MASGVQVSDTCLTTYQELKLGKKHKYIIFTLENDYKEIIVKKTSTSSKYDDFVGDLPENECRWAIYDFEFEKDGTKRDKLVFVSWSPDNAKIKPKMVFASSRDGLRRRLDGISLEVQCTDYAEVSYETVLEKALRGAR